MSEYVISTVTIFYLENTLSAKDKDDSIVNFDALDAEDTDTPDEEQKLKAVLTSLKGKLEAEDYASLLEALGVKDEMSNAELYEAMKALLKGDEEKDPKDKDPKDEDPKDEDKLAGDYKDFMKKCMEGGKDLKACQEEYKEKYPEPAPKEEEISEVEELAKQMLEKKAADAKENPTEKLLKEALARIKLLEDKDLDAGVSAKVDELIKDQHVAPVMKEGILKLAARLDDEGKDELLDFFRKTMKLSPFQDVGHLDAFGRPGAPSGAVLSPERKAELLRLHGIDQLILDKADQDKLPWRKGNN